MSKGQNDSGLMSSAGLVRYFDSDDGYTITPMSIATFSVLLGLFVILLNVAL